MVARGEAREDRLGVGQETVPVVRRADLTIREPYVLAFPVTVADCIRLKPRPEHIGRVLRKAVQPGEPTWRDIEVKDRIVGHRPRPSFVRGPGRRIGKCRCGGTTRSQDFDLLGQAACHGLSMLWLMGISRLTTIQA